MLSLQQIESDLKDALKARDSLRADTLRGLKTRVQNELTKAGSKPGQDLSESEIFALIRSEIKKRRDSAEAFKQGNRPEQAKKEEDEAALLQHYLPAQMPEAQLAQIVDQAIADMSALPADFGKVMGKLKAQLGDQADGATLSRLLRERLK
ncbi:MAG: GatB/YqeY domain-containing protein [Patescibacteria group bacterium]|nr:GatB/YqeY domain-containing protein [Patescibacteria group bacterium]